MSVEPERWWFLRYRVPVISVVLVLTVLLGSFIPQLRFDFSAQRLVESINDVPESRRWQEFIDVFGHSDNMLFVLFVAPPGGTVLTPEVRSYIKKHSLDFQQRPYVANLTSLHNAPTVQANATSVALVEAGELSPEQLRGDTLVRGTLLSRQATVAVSIIEISDEYRYLEGLEQVIGEMESWFKNNTPPGATTTAMAGIPFIRVEMIRAMVREELRFIPITAVLVTLLLLLFFRHFARTLFPLLTVLVAVVWAVGLAALLQIQIDVINHVMPALVMVIGISDSLHMVTRYQEECAAGKSKSQALRRTVKSLGAACLLTSTTTAVGFASLAATKTLVVRQFGLMCAGAVVIAFVVTVSLLPSLLSFTAAPPATPQRRHAFWRHSGRFCARLATRRPWTVVLSVLSLALVLAALGLSQVRADLHLLSFFTEGHRNKFGQQVIEKELGGVLALEVMLTFPEPGHHKNPETLRRMLQLQQRACELEGITQGRSVADFVSYLHTALAAGGGPKQMLPESRAELEQEWLLLEMGHSSLPLERFVAQQGKVLRISLAMADVGGRASLVLGKHITAQAAEVFRGVPVDVVVSGDPHMVAINARSVTGDLFFSLCLAAVVIFFCLLLALRSLRLAAVSVLPNAFPLLATVGAMALLNIELDMSTVVIFSISLGLAVDDTIHVLVRFREELRRGGVMVEILQRTLEGAGRAVLLTSVVLGAGMIVLSMSEFVPTRNFGVLTLITLLAALLADLIFLPALLALVYRRSGQNQPLSNHGGRGFKIKTELSTSTRGSNE